MKSSPHSYVCDSGRLASKIWSSMEYAPVARELVPKVSYFFISREKLLLEWYSENRSKWVKWAVFFFTLWRKKIQHYFSPRKKSRVIFPQNCRFQTEKNSVIFLNYRPPYFCQNCELQMKKLKSYFGQNWGSQTEIKKYRLISVKTVYFWRK